MEHSSAMNSNVANGVLARHNALGFVAPAVRRYALRRLGLFVVAMAPLVVFRGALTNGFVWDDYFNFVVNRGYRGLGWTELSWMFNSAQLSHWIPITWATLGFDYLMWGMWPTGYHLTNLVFHSANACIFYVIAGHILRTAVPGLQAIAWRAGALAAALFFAVHPLRTESVVWITERRDLVSGLFFLLAVLAYLRAREPDPASRRWFALSVIFFQLGVMSKSIVVTLPVVLLALDVYPLRRLRLSGSLSSQAKVILEKLPYLPMALLGSFVAIIIVGRDGGLLSFERLSLLDRIVLIFHSAWFYLWKTAFPFALSPLYELPQTVSAMAPRFLVAIVATVAITCFVVAARRRWPAVTAAWFSYLCILAPVSGGMHNGVQIAADRYTYLACLPWALLFGGGVMIVVRSGLGAALSPLAYKASLVGIGGWIAALALLASMQTAIWRDDESLWRHALASDPQCFVCHHNLGAVFARSGRAGEAVEHFERAVALRPTASVPRGALVLAFLSIQAHERADAELQVLRSLDPDVARTLSPAFLGTW
jgi:protein O-mannosyl-transferase